MNELTTNTASAALATADDAKMAKIMSSSIFPGASPASVQMALDYCRARKLDPLQKPVHIVPMWDSKAKCMRDVIMPGLNLYRTQAAQSGQHAGTSLPRFGQVLAFNMGGSHIEAPEFCEVTVKRLLNNGTVAEFADVVYFAEACSTSKDGRPTPMWLKSPRMMLAKTAESRALRKAFPDLNAAESAEEMEGRTYFGDGEAQPAAPAAEPAPADLYDKALAAASSGLKSYEAFFKGLTPAERVALKAEHAKLKAIAQDADKPADAIEDAAIVEPEV